jgi:hypothetical protein
MTKKDLFVVIIKIFGLYWFILTIFGVLPHVIQSFAFGFDLNMILVVIASLLISVGLLLILLFRTNSIVNFLKLDKGFDNENIQLGNLDNEGILKLAILLIGGFLILDYIPSLLFNIINAFKYRANFTAVEGTNVNYFDIATGIVNIVIGYLLITNYKWLAGFFAKR